MIQDLHLYTSEYTATGGEYLVPINIAIYNHGTDFLLVFLDGEYISGTDYSVNATDKKLIFTEALTAGQLVQILMFKTDGVELYTEEFGAPESRNEALLQNILGADNVTLYPESRIEVLLYALLEHLDIDASSNSNVMACLTNIKANWESYSTGITHVAPVAAGGPVAGVIVYKYTDDYGAVLIMSYHPMFPHPAYCRMFAGEWTTPYWI